MEDEFSKFKRSTDADPYASYKRSATPTEEPGWFQPGSRSDSLVRGFSNAATFGFGDEIQAGLRSMVPGSQSYKQLRDEQRAANEAATAAHPGYNLAGTIAGALPQGIQAARGAAMAAPGLVRGALGAAKVGAKQGAIQGVGATESITDPAQVAKDVAANAALTGVSSGVAVPAAAAVTKFGAPVLKYLKDAATNKTAAATAQALTDGVPAAVAPSVAPMQTAGAALVDKFSLPSVGALLGAAEVNIMGNNNGQRPDWVADPYSAAVDTAIGAGAGAAAGMGLRYGGRMAANIGGDALQAVKPVIKNSFNSVQQGVDNLVTTGSNNGVPKQSFSKLNQWFKAGKSSANPTVQQATQQVEQAVANGGEDAARKAAMEASKSTTGRAVSNTDSPVNKGGSDPNDLDEFFRQLRGG